MVLPITNHDKAIIALAGIVTIGPFLMAAPRDQVKPALCETKTVKRPE